MSAKRYKFPRTFHIPASLSKTEDDKTLDDYSIFEDNEVVITEKMDGESFTCYSDGHTHARSIDSNNHPSRNFGKGIAASIRYSIPDGWRISCENLFAKHSILYWNLRGYLYLFGAWDADNNYISYDDLLALNDKLGLPMPNVLYRGGFSIEVVTQLIKALGTKLTEGFVIRNAQSFNYKDYSKNTGKFVRANHVQSEDHWMHKTIIQNQIINQ